MQMFFFSSSPTNLLSFAKQKHRLSNKIWALHHMTRATAVTQKVDTVALKAQTVLSTSVNTKVEFLLLLKNVQVTYVTMVPRVGNETLHPLGVSMGNAVSVTTVQRAPVEYIIHFFVWSLRPKHGTHPRGRSVSFPTRGTMVTFVTWDIPLHGNFELRPLGVTMGKRYTHATMLRGVQAKRKRHVLSQLYQAKGVAPVTV